MSRNRARTKCLHGSLQSPTLNIVLPNVSGCTGYIIYGIAPIPVRVAVGEHIRIEPTPTGYNVWEQDK